MNKEICVCNRGGCAVPLTLALSHNGTFNIPLQAKYINAWVVSVSQSPYHFSLKLALSFDAPDPTATTHVGRLQGGSSIPDQTVSYKLRNLKCFYKSVSIALKCLCVFVYDRIIYAVNLFL